MTEVADLVARTQRATAQLRENSSDFGKGYLVGLFGIHHKADPDILRSPFWGLPAAAPRQEVFDRRQELQGRFEKMSKN